MFSKINHVAIVSENYAKSALFYQAVFGMRTSDKTQVSRAQTVGDGYVGLNINPRKGGRPAGLDHFGVEVEDVETALDRMQTRYPLARWVQRPSNRPFSLSEMDLLGLFANQAAVALDLLLRARRAQAVLDGGGELGALARIATRLEAMGEETRGAGLELLRALERVLK